jgi:lipid-A-disaccharide synthase
MQRVMIIAGEASGDLHGSGVVRELKRLQPGIDVYGVGGDKMQNAGMEIIYHIRDLGFMGFFEVLQHLPFIKTMERTLEQVVKFKRPDVLVLIDYPGFNLRFARIAKRYNVKIVYYISPQIWAWHKSRVKTIRQFVDLMLVIFPFEEKFYREEHVPVEFVGHPLLEVITSSLSRKEFCKKFGLDERKKIIALLPGSRKQEIENIFPAMLDASRLIAAKAECEIVVGVAPTLDEQYLKMLYRLGSVLLIKGLTYDVMANADIAVVTSGTATLETACFGTPMVVVYKTSWPTYWIGRMLVRVKNIGLVNIVAGERIVPEFIQRSASPRLLAREVLAMLGNAAALADMRSKLSGVRGKLGKPGASERAARAILNVNKV